MNRNLLKPISCFVCGAVLATGLTAGALALNNPFKKQDPDNTAQTSFKTENTEESKISKDETVYVLAGADGSVKKIIVSDWIKNSLKQGSVTDSGDLKNIETVKDDTRYSMNSENMRVWDTNGNDVYYKGEAEKELPVNLKISYTLDGKSISAEDLAGKSGHVSIKFDYENNQYENVTIDGKSEKIYVPFAMLTGMMLDNDVFSNISVSNGKMINDGDRSVIIGLALPGLSQNLKLDGSAAKLPDSVEISADVKNFEMTTTVTIATNELFNKLDSSDFDSVDDLSSSVDKLTSAMKQLTDGSSALYGGLCTLLDKSQELISGIDTLAQGAAKLTNGAGQLSSGASDLNSGSKELTNGLSKLASNNSDLNSGSKQVFDSLLDIANKQIAAAEISAPTLTIENYSEVIDKILSSLTDTAVNAEVKKVVASKVEAYRPTVTTAVTAAVREEVTQKVTNAVREEVQTAVLAANNLTKEEYEAAVKAGSPVAAKITEAIDNKMQSDDIKAKINTNVEAQMNSDTIKTLISSKVSEQLNQLVEQQMQSSEVKAQLAAALEKAKSGRESLTSLKAQLDSYKKFYDGLNQYTAGVASAKEGSERLNNGTESLNNGAETLYSGMKELYNGILTLKNGTPALVSGVTELKNGSMKLSNGLNEFNNQGVEKLTSVINTDIKDLVTRFKATVDVSKNYKSFSGISDEMDGQVKFIYRTDSIKSSK